MLKSSVGSQRLREQTQRRGERPLWAELPVGAHGQDPPKNRFLPIDKLDLDSFAKEKTSPGELALVKFLRMLDHICHRAPGKNLHFEPNADILRSVPRLFHSVGSGRVCQQSQWYRSFRRLSGGSCLGPNVHLVLPPPGLACPISSGSRVSAPLGIRVVSVPHTLPGLGSRPVTKTVASRMGSLPAGGSR
jgi:hypothetical protein